MPDTLAILAPCLFDGERWLADAAVIVEGGRIASVGPSAAVPAGARRTVLPESAVLAPGFVDIQVNGGGGVLLNDSAAPEDVTRLVAAHRRHGTTGLMLTLISDTREVLHRFASEAREALAVPGVIGFHIEGPFLNPARKGVHPEAVLRQPDETDFAVLAALAGLAPTMVTLAPEIVPEDAVARLAAAGVKVFIGHSAASAATVRAAADAGATGVTHLFNAMSQMTPREPGVVGALLDDARLVAGLICDGLHVDPANLRIAFAAAGRERLALVTDAMPSLGSPEPGFLLQGRWITREGERLVAADGTLAGAHLGMDQAVANAVAMMRVTLEDALVMASLTPARALGLAHERGRLAPGFRADMVALDAGLRTLATWIGGES